MSTKKNDPPRWIGVMVVALLLGGAAAVGVMLGRTYKPHAHDEALSDVSGGTLYTCGMHPWVIQPEPGQCPICHMDLTPIDPAKFTGELTIDPTVAQNIGVRLGEVTRGPLTRTITTVGSVEHDQTMVHDVNLRFEGWIEKLYVDTTGQHVHAGDPLFDIYSPQLLATQQELLIGRDNPSLVHGARDRLLNLGLTSAQIDAVLAEGAPRRVVTMLSPASGHVIEKSAFEGMRVEPATLLYRIADHTSVWVDVVVYEQHLPFVREGMEAAMTLAAVPGRTFTGRVAFEYPHLDPATRQLTIRVMADNPDLLLKPGMFANVTLTGRIEGDAVLAPREAVIDTGERRVAFVALGAGRFEPRAVTLGATTGDGRVQVLEGLKPGERVVVSGQFLLDSESRLREAIAAMIPPEAGRGAAGGGGAAAGHGHAATEPVLRDPMPGEVLRHYELEKCLVSGLPLGAMGEPIVKAYGDMQIRFCCTDCVGKFEGDPRTYLSQLRPEAGE